MSKEIISVSLWNADYDGSQAINQALPKIKGLLSSHRPQRSGSKTVYLIVEVLEP